ncbi:Type II secretion system GspH family protein [Candidatus Magnetomoraceae bacterium gMMP-1]
MKKIRENKGFTLIEILLVIVIIGILLAVIVPRAYRANIDSKYGLVRQNCSELASFASQWMEQQMEAQLETSTATINSYMASLCNSSDVADMADSEQAWIALQTSSNWNDTGFTTAAVDVDGRFTPTSPAVDDGPETYVEDTIVPERIPRNPFNGASVFISANDPVTAGAPIVGAIACAGIQDVNTNYNYYAFVFQGTDSTSTDVTSDDAFHAAQKSADLAGLRNGVFIVRTTKN